MILPFAGDQVAATGLLEFPAQQDKASWVLREELAEAAAYVLTTAGHENKTYVLANTEATSFQDIAQNLSATLGRDVRYQSPPVAEFAAALTQAGIPAPYVGMFTTWARAVAEGMLEIEDATLATFLGRQPTSTAQFIERVYK